MKFLIAAAIAFCLSTLTLAADAPASAPKVQKFSPFKSFPTYALRVDTDSILLHSSKDESEMPLVTLDVQIVLAEEDVYEGPPPQSTKISVKAYVNSLVVDCAHDRLFVVRSQTFDTTGKRRMVVEKLMTVENAHVKSTPVAEVMDNLICPPLLQRYKKPAPVTKDFRNWT